LLQNGREVAKLSNQISTIGQPDRVIVITNARAGFT